MTHYSNNTCQQRQECCCADRKPSKGMTSCTLATAKGHPQFPRRCITVITSECATEPQPPGKQAQCSCI